MAAQDGGQDYGRVVSELRGGRKTSHWMWFIFPQITGLGHSELSKRYAISSLDEARAYLDHPVLGKRLRECAGVLLELDHLSAEDVFGSIDAIKLRSSMTLFDRAADDDAALFREVLYIDEGSVLDQRRGRRRGRPLPARYPARPWRRGGSGGGSTHRCGSPSQRTGAVRAETGTTPAQWVLDQRTAAAQALLETTDLPVELVAQRRWDPRTAYGCVGAGVDVGPPIIGTSGSPAPPADCQVKGSSRSVRPPARVASRAA